MGMFVVGRSTYSAMGAINALGLTTSLQLCLDAGDVNSYSGSGQSWLDLSGNGYDFFRGANGSAAADDPTFNGSAGALTSSEYWGFDGGDFFTYDSANETWMQDIHKDNATVSFAFWVYSKAIAASGNEVLIGTNGSGASPTGFRMYLFQGGGQAAFFVQNGGATVLQISSLAEGLTASDNTWHFVALSFAEGVGATWQIDGTQAVEVDSTAYSSPASGDASQTMCLANAGSGGIATLDNGSRLAMALVWSRALSATELMDLFNATRDRFGI